MPKPGSLSLAERVDRMDEKSRRVANWSLGSRAILLHSMYVPGDPPDFWLSPPHLAAKWVVVKVRTYIRTM